MHSNRSLWSFLTISSNVFMLELSLSAMSAPYSINRFRESKLLKKPENCAGVHPSLFLMLTAYFGLSTFERMKSTMWTSFVVAAMWSAVSPSDVFGFRS